jgi:twitching motility two-component system response regulator PilG
MQGELHEIDIRSILHLAEVGQRSGALLIEAYPQLAQPALGERPEPVEGAHLTWCVFFAGGKIVYAGPRDSGQQRLSQLLQRHGIEDLSQHLENSAHLASHPWEYGAILTLLESQVLSPDQSRSLLRQMVQETLFELIGLGQGRFFFDFDSAMGNASLACFEIGPLLQTLGKQLQEWKGFYPHIQSPDQCPTIVHPEELGQALPVATVNTLLKCADGQTSLRDLSYRFDRNLVMIARAIYPCVQRGWIQMDGSGDSRPLRLESPEICSPWRIVCLDDALVVRQALRLVLEQYHCQVTDIAHPVEALTMIFQSQPDLIFCDIMMPEIDGYEVCAMLRQSARFHRTPIIMLTGSDGFIDRVRAKMVGATDYLAKPFQEEELVMLLERYLGWKGLKKGFSKYLESVLNPESEVETVGSPTVFSVKSD